MRGTVGVDAATRAAEVQKELKRIYGSYAEPTDWVEFDAESLKLKRDDDEEDEKP